MDVDKSLRQLRERADSTLLRDVVFSVEMEQKILSKINKQKKQGALSPILYAAAFLMIGLAVWKWVPLGEEHRLSNQPERSETILPGAAWNPPVLWQPSPEQTGTYDNKPFHYFGEKPVRIITGELYEKQTQKVMWLLNGPFAEEVELVAISAEGKRVNLGKWRVADPLYDADGHFPSGIALPTPGIWKLQVLSNGKYIGHVFVEVKPGVAPANRDLVEPLIMAYIKTHEAFAWLGEDQDITIDVLGVESPNAETKRVYAWVKGLSKDPLRSSGISAPAAFDIWYDGSEYKVVGHRMPEDGNRYWSSIQEIFPENIVQMIKHRSGAEK
ncbi:hypothetical protein [Brevibacillus sp. H7]|uniref:hypothetical protein n=1 Tax=Brevibacillus sp. H7 TaxID=3349138 RepID=UPI00380CE611